MAPLALLILSLAPAAASAADHCVPTAQPGCVAAYPSIADAVTAATDGDTIRLAEGTFTEQVVTEKLLAFEGAGAGATVIQAPDADSSNALELTGGGAVRSLQAVGGLGMFAGTAIVLGSVDAPVSYTVEDVVAVAPSNESGFFGGDGVRVDSAEPVDVTIRDSELSGGGSLISGSGLSTFGAHTVTVEGSLLQAASPFGANAINIDDGAAIELSDSEVEGATALAVADSTAVVERSTLTSNGTGPVLNIYDDTAADAAPEAPTSVTVRDSLVAVESADPSPIGAYIYGNGEPLTVKLVGSTVAVGDGPGATGLVVRGAENTPNSVLTTLRNSVVRADAQDFPADMTADNATIEAFSSAFTTTTVENGGIVPDPASNGNVGGDPLLAADFAPTPASPLVDAGDDAFVEAGETDLLGADRSLDGDGDCQARPDIGAFELADACVPPPTDPGGPRDPGGTPIPPGPGTGPTPDANDTTAPRIRNVSLTRKRFASRRAEGVERGTTIRFDLSEDARLVLVIERRLPGRRVAGADSRCVKPTRAKAKRERCIRFVKVGTLQATGSAGANSLRFSGLLNGRPLAAGRYRTNLHAIDAAGNSSVRRPRFHVLTP